MKKVTLYTTPYCPYCIAALDYLKKNGIPFENHDVSRNNTLREKVSKENGGFRTVPMIIAGDIFIGGYDDMMHLIRAGHFEAMLKD